MMLLDFLPIIVMPLLLLAFAVIMLFSGKPLLDSFITGVKEGIECCTNLLPTLILVMCAVGMLFSSGGVDILCGLFRPLFSFFEIPEEMLPTIVLRPFSGSGVTAIADRMFKETGPDSVPSKIACLLMGSTDTIIYTLSVYFSAVKIKKTRYALISSLIVFLFSIFVCVAVGNGIYS